MLWNIILEVRSIMQRFFWQRSYPSGTSSTSMEYEGNENSTTQCTWRGGSSLGSSVLEEPRIVILTKFCNEISDSLVRGNQIFDCQKETVMWGKSVTHNVAWTFWKLLRLEDWTTTERGGRDRRFLGCSVSWEDRVCQESDTFWSGKRYRPFSIVFSDWSWIRVPLEFSCELESQ